MKRLIVLIFCFYGFLGSLFANKRSVFQEVNTIADTFTIQKPLFVYQYTSWCSPSRAEFDTLVSLFEQNRNLFHFVLITDANAIKNLSVAMQQMKPEAVVLLNDFGYKRMDYKAAEKLSQDFFEVYKTKIELWGPGALYFYDASTKEVKFYYLPNRKASIEATMEKLETL